MKLLVSWDITVNSIKQVPQYKYRTAQKMKFSIKDFFSKCDQVRKSLIALLITKFNSESFKFT